MIIANDEHICIASKKGVCECDKDGLWVESLQRDFGINVTVPVFWFSRIKVQPQYYNTGVGRDMMLKLIEIADERNIAIFNAPNPYGNRDMESLTKFFEGFGFQRIYDDEGNMCLLRLPKGTRNEHTC